MLDVVRTTIGVNASGSGMGPSDGNACTDQSLDIWEGRIYGLLSPRRAFDEADQTRVRQIDGGVMRGPDGAANDRDRWAAFRHAGRRDRRSQSHRRSTAEISHG